MLQAWPWDPYSILIESFSHEVGKHVFRSVLRHADWSHVEMEPVQDPYRYAQDWNFFHQRNQKFNLATHKTPGHLTQVVFWVHYFFFFCIHGLRKSKGHMQPVSHTTGSRDKGFGIYALGQIKNPQPIPDLARSDTANTYTHSLQQHAVKNSLHLLLVAIYLKPVYKIKRNRFKNPPILWAYCSTYSCLLLTVSLLSALGPIHLSMTPTITPSH